MQPEEIIQQKEWKELNEEEKDILQSLAADEEEYNLLKKMMMIADEAVIDVPVIIPAVQTKLHQSLKTGGVQKKGGLKWYYTAAAILLIAVFSTWLMVRDNKDEPNDVSINWRIPTIPTTRPKIDTPYDRYVGHGQQESHKKDDKPALVTNDKHSQPSKTIDPPTVVKKKATDNPQISYTAISTLIKDDSKLMAFVTEVY